MNKKILKINSVIMMSIVSIIFICVAYYMLITVLHPSVPGSWDDLGKFFTVFFGVWIGMLISPLMLSAINTLRYLKGKNTSQKAINSSMIGVVVWIVFVLLCMYQIYVYSFEDYDSIKVFIIPIIISVLMYLSPLLINANGLYKDNNNKETYNKLYKKYKILTIITVVLIIILTGCFCFLFIYDNILNKIELSEDNTYTYAQFKSELEDRKLLYELPEKKREPTLREITAIEASKNRSEPYTHRFAENATESNGYLSVWSDSKFPMYMYNSYTSFFSYYKNCFIKGGGILSIDYGSDRKQYPTLACIYNNHCIKIQHVDRIDAQTIDRISKLIINK